MVKLGEEAHEEKTPPKCDQQEAPNVTDAYENDSEIVRSYNRSVDKVEKVLSISRDDPDGEHNDVVMEVLQEIEDDMALWRGGDEDNDNGKVLFGDKDDDNDRDSDFMPDDNDDQEVDKFEVVLTPRQCCSG